MVLHKDITSIGTDALSGVVNGTFLTIYTGNDPERLKTLNGISRFNTKYIYSYEQYLLDIENGVTYNQNTIIYGADYCIELNGGEHTMNDTPTCVLPSGCIKCDRMPGEPALGHIEGALVSIVLSHSTKRATRPTPAQDARMRFWRRTVQSQSSQPRAMRAAQI